MTVTLSHALTVTVAELRTAHAVAQLLLSGSRPLMPGWDADSIRRFASSITGEDYLRTKKGLQRATAHIERAIELSLEALETA